VLRCGHGSTVIDPRKPAARHNCRATSRMIRRTVSK
jgi:hypothetical protein